MDISIFYEQAQRLLSGDIYRRLKSVMTLSQACWFHTLAVEHLGDAILLQNRLAYSPSTVI
jgi:hypothetical protein